MPLRKIPISSDPKLTYTQKPLLDASVRFDLQLDREKVVEPVDSDISAQLLAQEKAVDLFASFANLGHVKSPGLIVNMKSGINMEPKRPLY